MYVTLISATKGKERKINAAPKSQGVFPLFNGF